MLTVVSGGSASGKSEFAESLVLASSCTQRFYLATMIPFDDECRARIQKHRQMRAKKGFQTIEVPTDLQKVSFDAEPSQRIALLECMSNLVANEIFSESGAGSQTFEAILEGMEHLLNQCSEVIVVTNELFSDGVAYDEGTQDYLATLGKVNQALSARADRVYEVVAGIPICWKESLL